MKVILISKVANYGNIGDVVDVKNGYARNFLIPGKKAIHYSLENYKSFEDKKKEIESKNQEALVKATEVKASIDGKDIIIIENASDDGRLYGAVSTAMIADKVSQILSNLEITRSDIALEKPIKETGVYNVAVNLHSDVVAKVRLVVARNESEVKGVIEQAKFKSAKERSEDSEAKTVAKKGKKETSDLDDANDIADQELVSAAE